MSNNSASNAPERHWCALLSPFVCEKELLSTQNSHWKNGFSTLDAPTRAFASIAKSISGLQLPHHSFWHKFKAFVHAGFARFWLLVAQWSPESRRRKSNINEKPKKWYYWKPLQAHFSIPPLYVYSTIQLHTSHTFYQYLVPHMTNFTAPHLHSSSHDVSICLRKGAPFTPK